MFDPEERTGSTAMRAATRGSLIRNEIASEIPYAANTHAHAEEVSASTTERHECRCAQSRGVGGNTQER